PIEETFRAKVLIRAPDKSEPSTHQARVKCPTSSIRASSTTRVPNTSSDTSEE
ncbi:Unknown protein, partial [Striga hermonthica]